MRLQTVLCAMAVSAMAASPVTYWSNQNGSGEIGTKAHVFCTVAPGFAGANWNFGSFSNDKNAKAIGETHTTGTTSGKTIAMDLVRTLLPDGSLKLDYALTPKEDVVLNSLHVNLNFDSVYSTKIAFKLGDKEKAPFPMTFKNVMVANANCKSFELFTPDGVLSATLEGNAYVMIQDNRQWGGGMEVRIGPQMPQGEPWPGGKSFNLAMTLKWDAGMEVATMEPVVLKANDDWSVLDTRLGVKPGSALDFTVFKFADGPAGKYGWIRANGPHFEFEKLPGVPQRFYGVNFCFSAHDLSHEQSEQLAERLWRLGYNTVRYHHYEGNLQDRSSGSSIVLNPQKLERLDYLHYQLRQRGIYVTTDTFVSRTVFAKEVFDGEEGNLDMNEIKMLLPVNDRMFENWKGFCRAFLGHLNPYTGLTYAQDPAVAWISLINEGNYGNYFGGLRDRTRKEWLRAWNDWTQKKYGSAEKRNAAWGTAQDYAITFLPDGKGTVAERRDFERFQYDVETDMLRRMRDFLYKELGSKALLTDMNSWTNRTWSTMARNEFDYIDDHFYIDHPQFIEKSWQLPSKCDNTSPVLKGTPGGGHVAFTRLLDKPFAITEYNFSGPGRFRGVGGIMTGCLAALQDWGGVWRFAYSHGNWNMFNPSGAGYFDLASDPLNQCAERAILCLYLRGDMAPAPQKVAITLEDKYLDKDFQPGQGHVPGWSKLNLIAQVGYLIGKEGSKADADVSLGFSDNAPKATIAIDGNSPLSGANGGKLLELFRQKGWLSADNATDMGKPYTQSSNGQCVIDGTEDILVLNTPKTAGGFAPAGKSITTDAAQIKILDSDATVWISAVDDQPIASSKRLLITHLTDLQNTDMKYADIRRKVLQAWGHMPHIVQNGRAEITVKLQNPQNATVWRLRTDGERLSKLEAAVTADGLRIPLDIRGPHGAQLLYEVTID